MVVSENLIYAIETQTNTNIKFLVLAVILIYSIFLYLIKGKIDVNKNMLNYYLKIIFSVMPLIYIVFCPLMFLFLLNTNITMDLFYTIIVGTYFLNLALTIGLSLYKGGTIILQLFGFEDKASFKDSRSERKSLRKYG